MEKEGLYVGVALILGFLMLMTFSGGFDGSISLTGRVIDNETETCTEDWSCDDWTVCADDLQSRTCTDANTCGTEDNKPDESQACVVETIDNETETCTEDWSCDDWTVCADDLQSRTCTDANTCGTEDNKPDESQACVVEEACTEDWSCDDWSDCSGSTKTRSCDDSNSCGTEEDKPVESRACTVEEPEDTTSDTTDTPIIIDDSPPPLQEPEVIAPVPEPEVEESEPYLDDANQLTGGVVGDDNETCMGCVINETCYKVNKRKNDQYCLNATVVEWVPQKEINETCINNFECLKNSCREKEFVCEEEECSEEELKQIEEMEVEKICTEPGFVTKIFNWLRKFLKME